MYVYIFFLHEKWDLKDSSLNYFLMKIIQSGDHYVKPFYKQKQSYYVNT